MERGGRANLDKKNSSLMFRQVTPPHEWKEDSDFHYLRLTIPGFEANNITIHTNKYGQLVVRGDKQVTEHKYLSFEENFDLPKDAAIEDAGGRFEDDQIYCITIPKQQGKNPKLHEKDTLFGHQINIMPNAKQVSGHKGKQPVENNVGNSKEREEFPKKGNNYITSNPLGIISREDNKNKKIAFCVAFLFALLIVVAVSLILKFRH